MSCQYLVEILFEVGPTMAGGMSPGPITEQEMAAWQRNRRFSLQPWEIKYVIALSKLYASMSVEAQERDFPAPFSREPTPIEAKSVTQDLRAALRGMAGR